MEDSLLKTNFVGRDGFRWWIGQIPEIESWEKQATGPGWGTRYKVRIMGYHPYNTAELSDEDLPWAGVLMPPGNTGSANVSKTIKFNPGDTVIGFFLDGDSAQIPMIMGAFGNSYYAANAKEKGSTGAFGSFTGYTSYMKKPSKSVLRANQSNDANAGSQKSPANLSPADANKKTNNANYSASSGATIPLPVGPDKGGSKSKKTINKIKTAIESFVSFLKNLRDAFNDSIEYAKDWIKKEIDIRAEQITELVSGMISGMINSLFNKLIPLLKKGLAALYASVFAKVLAATLNPVAAHLAGVAAQVAMTKPVKVLQDLIPCVCNQIVSKMTGFIADILKSVADNILNFVQCVGDQVIGALFNGIVGQVVDGLASAIEGISKIVQFIENFSVEGLLRSGVDALLGLIGLASCNKKSKKDKFGAEKYKIGYGPIFQAEPDLSGILKNANDAQAISNAARSTEIPLDAASDLMGAFSLFSGAISNPNPFPTDLGSCYGGIPTICNPPTINIFGGGGEGASAIPIFGAVVGEGNSKTGSVIGVKITNPGNGYTFPPFVEVVDNCDQGYGACARSVIKNGKVEDIYIISEGENYPVDDTIPYSVSDVIIVDPGNGYEDGDTVTDNLGNTYKAQIFRGSIVKVTPIDRKDIRNIPRLTVKSDTGSGAILIANLDIRPEFKGEVQQVIDCILPSDDGSSSTQDTEFTPLPASETYIVTVSNPGSGNKFYIDGSQQRPLTLIRGRTYRFDVSDQSNTTHIISFVNNDDSALDSNYIVTYKGVSGTSESFVELTIKPTAINSKIKYICTVHSAMGFGEITIASLRSVGDVITTIADSTPISVPAITETPTPAPAPATAPTPAPAPAPTLPPPSSPPPSGGGGGYSY